MPKARNPQKGVPTTARIHPHVLAALRKLARKHKRRVSAEIDYACESWTLAYGTLTELIERHDARARS